MKASVAITFYTAFLTVFTLINWYILRRGSQAVDSIAWLKVIVRVIVIVGYLSFILGQILEKTTLQQMAATFKWIGSYWLAYMLYIILHLIVIDILRLINLGTGFFPDFIVNNINQMKLITFIALFLFSSLIIIIGMRNASNTEIKEISITVPGNDSKMKELKIMFASDIHLGSTIHKEDAQRLVDIADTLKPDIILFGGDVLDSDVKPALANNSGEPFKSLDPPLGVYSITGNHEYLGGDVEAATDYIESLNIKLIRDSVVKINKSFYIIGREDKERKIHTGKNRQTLKKLMQMTDEKLPVILLDHQPFNLEETAKLNIDLQLSGHTHNGQLWPLNYITDAIYENAWGYLQKENTHYYTSCGFGIWGPKVRIGSHSEIVVIRMKFEN